MPRPQLPVWAREIETLYESDTASQFVLHGNVHDRALLPLDGGSRLGSLEEFLGEIMLPRFDVVISYDLGNGIRIERGGAVFQEWPSAQRENSLPRAPRAAIETITHYLRYVGNLKSLGRRTLHVAVILRDAERICPAGTGGVGHELSALALSIRDWSTQAPFVRQPLATFLLCENRNDLHPILAGNSYSADVQVPLPDAGQIASALAAVAPAHAGVLPGGAQQAAELGPRLVGVSLGAVERLVKRLGHQRRELEDAHLVELKRGLVEEDVGGLISFLDSDKSLDDLVGLGPVKRWLRDDLALWRKGELEAVPKGYLLCGPVGTGKTYLVRCLAGEADVPVVRINNFRDRWIGSTEGNLETIFRLLHGLGRAVVFIDEADQALGRRGVSSSDGGLSGRVYSMLAEEMSRPENRGRILWVLASSRPDLVEVDLKRPGRIDVKIPLFPTTAPEEGFALLRGLCRARGVDVPKEAFAELEGLVPDLLTPGAAEALAVKTYRAVRIHEQAPLDALRACLTDYRHPVPRRVLEDQIRLAIEEATDADLIPAAIQQRYG